MSYLLDGSTIRAPYEFDETNSTQYAEHRVLSGNISRDYFGSNKRVWSLSFKNTKKADYDVIRAIYNSYLATGSAKTWEVTETNYDVDVTNVHIDLFVRSFSVRGTDYLSDFDLILKEA